MTSSTSASGTRRFLLAILALGLLVRLAVAVALRTWDFPSRWLFGFEMGMIGGAVADGMGFSWPGDPVQPTAWMAPAYPYLIAGVFRLFGSFSPASAAVLEALQTLTSLATCLALYVLGRRLFGERAGLAAAALFAVYPPAAHFSVQKIWDASAFALLVVVATLLFLDLRERPTLRRASAAGLVVGFGSLFEPNMLVFLPVGFLWLGARLRSARRAGRLFVVASLWVVLLTSPWLARNAVVFDRFVFLKSNFGHELLIGNLPVIRPDASAEGGSVKGVPAEFLTRAEVEFVKRVDEGRRNQFYLEKSTAYILARPAEFLRHTAARVLQFWTMTRGRGWAVYLVAATYFTLFLLALASLVLARARDSEALLLWALVALLPVGHYVTVTAHWRYRFPVEALLAVFAGFALIEGWRRSGGDRARWSDEPYFQDFGQDAGERPA